MNLTFCDSYFHSKITEFIISLSRLIKYLIEFLNLIRASPGFQLSLFFRFAFQHFLFILTFASSLNSFSSIFYCFLIFFATITQLRNNFLHSKFMRYSSFSIFLIPFLVLSNLYHFFRFSPRYLSSFQLCFQLFHLVCFSLFLLLLRLFFYYFFISIKMSIFIFYISISYIASSSISFAFSSFISFKDISIHIEFFLVYHMLQLLYFGMLYFSYL